MRCSKCGSDNPADAAFCEQCGHRLELVCPACKAPVSAGARFCKKCGASLSAAQVLSAPVATKSQPGAEIGLSAEPAAADVSGGERKTVTALFADMKGSTELMADLDPEEAREIADLKDAKTLLEEPA
jgi:hypothetical protein